jgi:hypothetical protein
MSINLPKSTADLLLQEACQMLSNANPVQSEWDYVAYDMYSGSINTPFVEIGGGGSVGTLAVQKQGSPPNKLRCLTGDLGLGLGPSPINAGFPLPNAPGTGIIYKLPNVCKTEITVNSFRLGYFSFTTSAQMGPSAGTTFLIFLPRFVPNLNLFSPGLILTAGVFIAIASTGGGLSPDVGVTCSMGCAI